MFLKRNKKEFGFTLIETIIAIFIFSLLAVGTGELFTHIFVNSNNRLLSINNIDQAQLIVNNFVNEIRTATVGSDNSYPIYKADDDEIIFFSSYGQVDGKILRIRYFLESNNLYKGIARLDETLSSYDLNNESISLLQNNIVNESEPVFYYYSNNYLDETNLLTQPVKIADIESIKIYLSILRQTERNSLSSFNVSSGATIRNIEDNL